MTDPAEQKLRNMQRHYDQAIQTLIAANHRIAAQRDRAEALVGQMYPTVEYFGTRFWADDAPDPKPDQEYELATPGTRYLGASEALRAYREYFKELVESGRV